MSFVLAEDVWLAKSFFFAEKDRQSSASGIVGNGCAVDAAADHQ